MMGHTMRRRDVLALLGGTAATTAWSWPRAARAQQPKRVGVLMAGAQTDPTAQSNLTILKQGPRKLGWSEEQNLQIEVRWSAGEANLIQAYATDLVGLFKPDVLLTATTANLIAMQRVTRTIPIIFTQVRDPVAQGFLPNLTRPGG